MPRIHVVPRDSGWAVKSEGASRAYRTYASKDEALRAAITHARQNGYEVVIHGRDNRIQKIISPREIEGKGGGCFITTACVEHYHLADNCYQLKALRKFRDKTLIRSSNGKKLISRYNLIAPIIVSHLKQDKEKDTIFSYVLKEIDKACVLLESKNHKGAVAIYRKTVKLLAKRYRII